MIHSKRAQFTTEYMIVVAIALAIVISFLIYAVVFYSSYFNNSAANEVKTAASSLTTEANYVLAEGIGSKISFPVYMPQLLNRSSFFCSNYVKIDSGQYSSISSAKTGMSGLLPLKAGNYIYYAWYNETGNVYLGLDFKISLITYNYSVSGSSLIYSLGFYGQNGLPLPKTNFNITVFNSNGNYVASSVQTAINGQYDGSLNIGSANSAYIIDVYPLGYDVFAPSCFSP